ncbi:MAG: hypothetical protein ACP5I3_11395, partial [Thermoproteus sp.]
MQDGSLHMQEALTLPMMVLIAGIIIAAGTVLIWQFQNAAAVARWADAYVYPLAKPYNSSSFWLGVEAAFADVRVDYVAVNGTVYSVGAAAPYGKAVWLNYSGGPLLAKCGSVVEIAVSNGGVSRVERFRAVCPKQYTSTFVENINDFVRGALAFADFAFNALSNQSLLAIDVGDDDNTAYFTLYNTWHWPLLVWSGSIWYDPIGPWGIFGDLRVNLPRTVNPGQSIVLRPIGSAMYGSGPGDVAGEWYRVDLAVSYFGVVANGSIGYLNGKIFTENAWAGNPQYIIAYDNSSKKVLVSPGAYVDVANGYVEAFNITAGYVIRYGSGPATEIGYGMLNKTWIGNGAFTVVDSIDEGIVKGKIYMTTDYNTYKYLIYAFPAYPITANTSSSGPPYLSINGKYLYGNSVIQGLAALSPVRTYAVEARNNMTDWLITVGVPGYSPVDNRSTLSVLAKPGDKVVVKLTTAYAEVATPGGVYVERTPYWTPPVPDFNMTYPAVFFLSPDGSLWGALVGYRPADGAVLVKTNTVLSCLSYASWPPKPVNDEIGPGLYAMKYYDTCQAPNGARIEYSEVWISWSSYSRGITVEYPLSNWFPQNLVCEWWGCYYDTVWQLAFGSDPVAAINSVSGVKTVVIYLGSQSAAAYINTTQGTALAANASWFSIPLLYEINP